MDGNALVALVKSFLDPATTAGMLIIPSACVVYCIVQAIKWYASDEQEQQPEEKEQKAKEEESPDQKEAEALIRKALERSEEHEAEKKARLRKAPLSPNERDW